MKQIIISLQGLNCSSCAVNIDLTLEDNQGVIESNTSYAKNLTTITFDPQKTNTDDILKTINQMGYKAEILE